MNYTDFEINNINKTIDNICQISEDINISNIINDIDKQTDILLLGESTHGTKEFYEIRTELTKQLIEKRGFNIVRLEAQWTHMWEINKYINNNSHYFTAREVMDKYLNEYPKWMWNNNIIEQLIEWLKDRNENINLFGIDVYSMIDSYKSLCDFLIEHDNKYGKFIKNSLNFLNNFKNGQEYGNELINGNLKYNSNKIIAFLQNLLSTLQWDKFPYYNASDIDKLNADQNAEILVNADEYYRKMFSEPPGSQAAWNIRDQHMATTLMKIKQYYPDSKIIVWAHNSHVGSALGTANGSSNFNENNSWNLGQMSREIFGKTEIIGFYTNVGTVTASEKWGTQYNSFELNQVIENSYEDYFDKISKKLNKNCFYINLNPLIIRNNNISNNNFSEDNSNNFSEINSNIFRSEFPFKIRTINSQNKITKNIAINSEVILGNIPRGSEFIAIKREFTQNNNISRLQLKDGTWITEYIKYSNINKFIEIIDSIKELTAEEFFTEFRLQRWIGVNYIKHAEETSHYGETSMIKQYNKIIFINKSNSLI